MNFEPSKLEVARCLLRHDIDKMAIGVDYEYRDSEYIWVCEKCEIAFSEPDLSFYHKYAER